MLGTILSFSCADALAQTVLPSQVTPSSFQPASPAARAVFEISSAAALQAPPGAAQARLHLGSVKLQGAFADVASANAAVVKALSGREVSVADIYAEAAALERAYAEAGYVLVRVTIPPQRLAEGGPVIITINDGFFERVDVEAVPRQMRAFVLARVKRLVGQHHVRLSAIERSILLAGEGAGLRLGSALMRGTTPNGVVLKLDGDYTPASASVSADNRLSDSLGGVQSSAQVAFNSAFGFGEQVYGSVNLGLGKGLSAAIMPDQSPLMTLGLGASVPLGSDGFSLNPEITYSKTRPTPSSALVPATEGLMERFALRGEYALRRSRLLNIIVAGGVESLMQRSTALALGQDLSLDFYQSGHLGLGVTGSLPSGATYSFMGTFSQGLGGRGQADVVGTAPTLSRKDASPWFEKASAEGHFTMPLPAQLGLSLAARGQSSFGKPLFTAEQLSLDSADAVSGLAPSSLSVDTGALLRAEAKRDFNLSPGLIASPYIFAAGGLGQLYNAQVGEQPYPWAFAYGVGLRTTFIPPKSQTGLTLSLELAQAQSNRPGADRESRANLSGSFRF